MNRRSAALPVLSASLALGLLADHLLRADSWGLNVPAGAAAFAVVLAWINSRSTIPLARGWKTTLAVGLASAALVAWRSSPALQSADLLFLLVSILTASAVPLLGSLRFAGIADAAHAALVYGVHALIGPVFLVTNDLKQEEPAPAAPALRTVIRLARGGALAFPPLFVIGVLFMAADPVFDRAVHSIVDVDFRALFGHLFLTGAVAWAITGFLRGRFAAEPVPFLVRAKTLRLGLVELCMVLGSLILLFTVFIAVQYRYLFEGASLAGLVPGLTYAEYARRGFFELVVVAAFTLPLLLIADWLFVAPGRAARSIFRVMNLMLLCLVFLVLVSAFRRMSLYQQEYGLTELRFFATAFMGWLAIVLLWFSLTVLRGRRDLFFSGGLAVTFAVLVFLHWMNPDEFIVRTNSSRISEGKTFDVCYNARLGDDAVPALVRSAPLLREADRKALMGELHRRFVRDADWRSWTLSHWTARALLQAVPASTESSTNGGSPS
jgi:hypothetical protein